MQTEPLARYVISGPRADGTYLVQYREATGDLLDIGSADDYESAREIALADEYLMQRS